MDNEERKGLTDNLEIKRSTSAATAPAVSQLEQVHDDFALAMALQEQERSLSMFFTGTVESEDDNEENDGGVEDESEGSGSGHRNIDDNEYEFLEGHEFDEEMEFLEGQDSNSEDEGEEEEEEEEEEEDMEEDEIDPDELTYEELIALGEFIGEEKRGLTLTEISRCLMPLKYQSSDVKTGVDRCVICQVEYEEGEPLVGLPHCHHPYHSECISQWLQVKKICPICSNEVSPPSPPPKNIARNV